MTSKPMGASGVFVLPPFLIGSEYATRANGTVKFIGMSDGVCEFVGADGCVFSIKNTFNDLITFIGTTKVAEFSRNPHNVECGIGVD